MPPSFFQNSKNWIIFSHVEKKCQKNCTGPPPPPELHIRIALYTAWCSFVFNLIFWTQIMFDWPNFLFQSVSTSVDILLDSLDRNFILKKNSSESSRVRLCFKRVQSTRRVFLKEHCNFYASTENVLPYCVQHNCCAWIWD